jgi:hypothetical protein
MPTNVITINLDHDSLMQLRAIAADQNVTAPEWATLALLAMLDRAADADKTPPDNRPQIEQWLGHTMTQPPIPADSDAD